MMHNHLKPGDLVKSTAGRDKGKIFAVLSTDGSFANIANGRLRKVQKPKRKKNRHLSAQRVHSVFLAEKIANGELPTNREVYAEVKKACAEVEKNAER